MKKLKYAEKVANKLVKEIDSDYDIEPGTCTFESDNKKHPIVTIIYPYGIKRDYDLLQCYIAHEEDDISISQSIAEVLAKIETDIENTRQIFSEETFEENNQSEPAARNYRIYTLTEGYSYYVEFDIIAILSNSEIVNEIKEKMGTEKFYYIPLPSTGQSLNVFIKDSEELELLDILKSAQESVLNTPVAHIYKYDFERNKFIPAETTNQTTLENQEAIRNQEAMSVQNQNEISNNTYNRPSLSPEAQTYEHIPSETQTSEDVESENYESEDCNSDRANEFAEYDTDYADEFAEKMKELFCWRMGPNFTLQGTELVSGSIRMDMLEANNEYQTNNKDFLEFGDELVERFQILEAEAQAQGETEELDNDSQDNEDLDSYLPY